MEDFLPGLSRSAPRRGHVHKYVCLCERCVPQRNVGDLHCPPSVCLAEFVWELGSDEHYKILSA